MSALGWIATFLLLWLGLSFGSTGVVLPDTAALMAVALLLLVLVLLLYRLTGQRVLLSTLKRGCIVLLPVVLAASVPILFILHLDWLDIRLRQAILAGLLVATGWIVGFVFQSERQQRERAEQETDLLMALRSEVFTIVEKLDQHAITEQARQVQEKIRGSGDDEGQAYVPFSASESPATVYEAVSGNLHIVDAQTLEPVLRFYAAFSELATMVEDTHRAEFRALSAARRVVLHEELTQQRRATLYWGLRALAAINERIGVPDPTSIPRTGKNGDVTL